MVRHLISMKTILLLLSLGCAPLLAFDPAGPPPQKTIEWTMANLAAVKHPRIDFEDVPLDDAIVFANRIHVPKNYRVEVKVADESKLPATLINLKAKDMPQMELLGIIAGQAQMDLLIQPGVVTLVPRGKAPAPDGGKPAPEADNKESPPVDPKPESK